MAEIRINATGGVKLYDADDSHYAQILAGTISSNVDVLTLGSSSADFNIPVKVLGTTPTLTIGDAGAEDTKIVFDGNAQDFYIALDDSADDLLIGLGSTVGTTPAISINSDRDVTISDGAIDFDVASHDTSNGLKLGGTLVTATAAELNIMDGVTSTAAEINLIDGGTARGTTAIADGDGVLINDAGTMRMTSVETLATYIGGGITVGDQWRVTANFDGSVQPITSNWEQVDGVAQGTMGSAMTNSSGVWTFPSTGFYFVTFGTTAEHDGDLRYCYCIIDATTDNSSYTDVAYGWGHVKAISGATYINMNASTIIDVTDTANVKVRFGTNSLESSITWLGGSAQNQMCATFIRLGDT